MLKEKISSFIDARTRALIIGGTGTLGEALLSLIGRRFDVTVLSREELKQKRLKEKYPYVKFVLGDVRDEQSLEPHFLGKDVVFHLAAMKHVDMAEMNPEESIKINLLGSLNVAKQAIKNNLSYAVLSSTDKAVLPVNNYGMCKALSEQYFFYLNKSQDVTKFRVFRWGNVLGSRGSAVQTFLDDLKNDRPIKITDYRMSRFWIDIGQVAKFMLDNYDNAQPHLPMIPDMGAAKVTRIAEICARYLGKENSLRFEVSGIRPGEKIHECLFSSHDICLRSDTARQLTDDEILEMIRRYEEK